MSKAGVFLFLLLLTWAQAAKLSDFANLSASPTAKANAFLTSCRTAPVSVYGFSISSCTIYSSTITGYVKVGTTTFQCQILFTSSGYQVRATSSYSWATVGDLLGSFRLNAQMMKSIYLFNPSILATKFIGVDSYTIEGQISISSSYANDELSKAIGNVFPQGVAASATISVNTFSEQVYSISYMKFSVASLTVADMLTCSNVDLTAKNQAPLLAVSSSSCTASIMGSQISASIAMEWVASGTFKLDVYLLGSPTNFLSLYNIRLIGGYISAGMQDGVLTKKVLFGTVALADSSTTAAIRADLATNVYTLKFNSLTLSQVVSIVGSDYSVPSDISLRDFSLVLDKSEGFLKYSVEGTITIPASSFTFQTQMKLEGNAYTITGSASLGSSYDFEMLTVYDPVLNFYSSKYYQIMEVRGTIKIGSLSSIPTSVWFQTLNGVTVWRVIASLSPDMSITQAIPEFSNTLFQSLSLSDVALRYYPSVGYSLHGILNLNDIDVLSALRGFSGNLIPDKLSFTINAGMSLSFNPSGLIVPISTGFTPNWDLKYFQFYDEWQLSLQLVPASIGMTFSFNILIPGDMQPIPVTMNAKLEKTGMACTGETTAPWVNPFGLKGITVQSIAIDTAITYSTFAASGPTRFGFAGKFLMPGVGNVDVATLTDYKTGDSVISASISKLGFSAICGLANGLAQKDIFKFTFLPDIYIKNAAFTAAPKDCTIASRPYSKGLKISGWLYVYDIAFGIATFKMTDTSIVGTGRERDVSFIGMKFENVSVSVDISLTNQAFSMSAKVSFNLIFTMAQLSIQMTMSRDNINFQASTGMFDISVYGNPFNLDSIVLSGSISNSIVNILRSSVSDVITSKINYYATIKSAADKALNEVDSARRQAIDAFWSISRPENCGQFGVSLQDYEGEEELIEEQGYVDDDGAQVLLGSWFSDAIDTISDTAEDAADAVSDTATKAGTAIANAGQTAYDATKAALEEAAKKVAEAAKAAAEQALQVLKSACETALGSITKARSLVQELDSRLASAQTVATNAARDYNKYLQAWSIDKVTFSTTMGQLNRNAKASFTIHFTVGFYSYTVSYDLDSINALASLGNDMANVIMGKF